MHGAGWTRGTLWYSIWGQGGRSGAQVNVCSPAALPHLSLTALIPEQEESQPPAGTVDVQVLVAGELESQVQWQHGGYRGLMGKA